MKEVHIACPRCQADNTISLATLKNNGGHVLCQDCSFVFKVVPKHKTATIPVPPAAAGTQANQAKLHAQKLAAAIQAISASVKAASPSATDNTTTSPMRPLNREQPAPATRVKHTETAVPSINILLKQPPAPVTPSWPKQTLPFDLLDPEPPPQNAANAHTHVQIQTDSLVFTLLPNSNIEAATPPMVINDSAAHSQEMAQQQLALATQQENLHRQFNWTLASLVALTVLIIQLFYLLSMQ